MESGNCHFLAYIPSLTQPGEGGGALPPAFTISTITYKVVVYAPDERTDTLPLFLLHPYTYSVPTHELKWNKKLAGTAANKRKILS